MNGSRKFQFGSANDTEISHSAKKTGKWIYVLKETLCIRVWLSKEDRHTFTQRKCSITVLYKQKCEWQDTNKWRMWGYWVQQHFSRHGGSVSYLPIPLSLLLSRGAFSKNARGNIHDNLIWCWIKDGGVWGEKILSAILGEEAKNSVCS